MKSCRNKNSTWNESTTGATLSYWNISACQEPIFINIINNVSSASSMKWVSLFKAESSVHSVPFLSWTLQFHKARKKEEGERGEGRGGGGGSKRAGTAVKEETQGKQRLAEPESPPSLGYDWFFPCARMTKKQKNKNWKWCSKNKKDERGRGFLLGCCVGCFLFHKATLGFDAVVVVWGLAAATGFRLGALLHVGLCHTPPGGEVEGDTPLPRQSSVPLHAVPLQLWQKEPRVSPSPWTPLRKGEGFFTGDHLFGFSLELSQLVLRQRQEVVVIFWVLLPAHWFQ